MPAGTAIIQFIGIIVFTNQLTPDQHLQAIMPRIPGPQSIPFTSRTQQQPFMEMAEQRREPSTIEEHVALIVFPTNEILPASTWQTSLLQADSRLSYVLLDGEDVTISTRAPLPMRRRMGDDEAVPGLPRLKKQCCAAMRTLSPHNPAAVINLPAVIARACARPIENTIPRIDTHMTIPTDGVLIFSAVKLNDHSARRRMKQLLLKGNSQVIVAHVPKGFLTGTEMPIQMSHTMEHYLAYFSMTDAPNTCDSFECAHIDVVDHCEWSDIADVINAPHPILPPDQGLNLRVDFQCSNSQFP